MTDHAECEAKDAYQTQLISYLEDEITALRAVIAAYEKAIP